LKPSNQVPALGNTVDIETAFYSNRIGAPILSGYWQGPDFNPEQHAFYYVRVLETPTPNWTTWIICISASSYPKKQCHIDRIAPITRRFGVRPKVIRMPDRGQQRL
jgi:hypothetical protein